MATTTFVCSSRLTSPHSNQKAQPIPKALSIKEIINTNTSRSLNTLQIHSQLKNKQIVP